MTTIGPKKPSVAPPPVSGNLYHLAPRWRKTRPAATPTALVPRRFPVLLALPRSPNLATSGRGAGSIIWEDRTARPQAACFPKIRVHRRRGVVHLVSNRNSHRHRLQVLSRFSCRWNAWVAETSCRWWRPCAARGARLQTCTVPRKGRGAPHAAHRPPRQARLVTA